MRLRVCLHFFFSRLFKFVAASECQFHPLALNEERFLDAHNAVRKTPEKYNEEAASEVDEFAPLSWNDKLASKALDVIKACPKPDGHRGGDL